MTFKIDSSTVKDPISFEWQPPEVIGIDHVQKPIYSAYRSAVANFNTLTAAQFAAWQAADNGGYHSIQCPSPAGTADTTYSNVIIRLAGGAWGVGGNFYGASFRVERLVP